ncbi:MAG: hypothetical protein B7X31_10030 [Thiomonas sp. 13-66-29]|jgi:hypothetical protein|nr:MAG: hypothetical protein B7X31_10030 [Thiomonas sp. 13-66-29]
MSSKHNDRLLPGMTIPADILIPSAVYWVVFCSGLVFAQPENLLTGILTTMISGFLASGISLLANLFLYQSLSEIFGAGLHYSAVRAAMNVCVLLSVGLYIRAPHF